MFSAGTTCGASRGIVAEEADKLVAHPFAAAIDAVEEYEYPTLAALNGHAIGGGLELALSCDLRIAAGTIALGMPPAKLGLIYSHTGIRKFIDTIGAARTRELFLLGRRIDARTARAWGLVNFVAETDAARRRGARARGRARRQRAARAAGQQARDPRAARGRRARSTRPSSSELLELRRVLASPRRTSARRCARSPRSAPEWRGAERPGAAAIAVPSAAPRIFPPVPPLITREEALRLGELDDPVEIGALVERAWQVRGRALRRLDRHVLAGQRQVRRLRRGLRVLRAVALRRGRHADARDDGARADPRARAGRRGRGRAPLLHGHPGPGPLQARLREGAGRRPAGRRAHQPQALRLDRAHLGGARRGAQGRRRSSGSTTTSRRPSPTTPRSRPRSATRAGCGRSRRSRRPGWRPASAGSSTSASRASSASRWRSSSPASTRPASRSTC